MASYGQIADIVRHSARRASGWLRVAPFAERQQCAVVPGYSGIREGSRSKSGSDAFNEQSKRLMMEDVAILKGRIDMKKYRWQPDLDELLWKPSAAWDDDE